MTAPERIYMKPNDMYENGWARPIDTDQFDEEATEYIRADLAAVQPAQVQPDPRDEVIARLVEALSMAQVWLDYNGAYDMQSINAALAAAKAVKHD